MSHSKDGFFPRAGPFLPGLFCLACVGGWRLVNVTTTKNWPSMDGGGEDISPRCWAVLLSGPRADKLHPSSVVAVAGRQHLQHATAASTWMLTKGSQCVEFLSTLHQFIRPSHQGQASFSRLRPLLPISPIKLPITPHGRHPPSPHPPPKLPAWSRKRYRRRRRRRWPCPHCLPCVLCPAAGAGAAACSV